MAQLHPCAAWWGQPGALDVGQRHQTLASPSSSEAEPWAREEELAQSVPGPSSLSLSQLRRLRGSRALLGKGQGPARSRASLTLCLASEPPAPQRHVRRDPMAMALLSGQGRLHSQASWAWGPRSRTLTLLGLVPSRDTGVSWQSVSVEVPQPSIAPAPISPGAELAIESGSIPMSNSQNQSAQFRQTIILHGNSGKNGHNPNAWCPGNAAAQGLGWIGVCLPCNQRGWASLGSRTACCLLWSMDLPVFSPLSTHNTDPYSSAQCLPLPRSLWHDTPHSAIPPFPVWAGIPHLPWLEPSPHSGADSPDYRADQCRPH